MAIGAIAYIVVGLFNAFLCGFNQPKEAGSWPFWHTWLYVAIWPLGLPINIMNAGRAIGIKRLR